MADLARCVRFSPTPGPSCSLGLARTGLLVNLLAWERMSTALLTSDDLVAANGQLTHDCAMVHDLEWLGLQWSGTPWSHRLATPLVQSGRLAEYTTVAEQLLHEGYAYWCTCPQRDQPSSGYCACRDRELDAGAVVRFRMPARGPTYLDFASASACQALPAASDPVIVRADGTPTSWLAYPVDDRDYSVTLPIVDRGRARIDAYVIISAAIGHTPEAIVDLGRMTLPGSKLPPLASLRQQGRSAHSVRYALLASLFGSWPPDIPTDPRTAGIWCHWTRLRHMPTELDPRLMQGAHQPMQPSKSTPPLDPGSDADLGGSYVDHPHLSLRQVRARNGLLRRRLESPGSTSSAAPLTEVVPGLLNAYRALSRESDAVEVLRHLLEGTERLAFQAPDQRQVDLVDFLCASLADRRLLDDSQHAHYRDQLDSHGVELAVYVDGAPKRALRTGTNRSQDAVMAELVDRGYLDSHPSGDARVMYTPGRFISVDRRQEKQSKAMVPQEPSFQIVRQALSVTTVSELQNLLAASQLEPRSGRSSRRSLLPSHIGSWLVDCSPVLRRYVREMIGPRWTLSDTVLNVVLPGMPADDWHVDHPYYTNPDLAARPETLALQIVLPLGRFRRANGATELRSSFAGLGSPTTVTFEGTPGDALVMDARIEHRSRSNTTKEERPAVLLNVVREGLPVFTMADCSAGAT